ncbi:MAG: TolC family protein [Planctomycetales bacterium]|nr:TolC family protein [Planctomycetales bacterium]
MRRLTQPQAREAASIAVLAQSPTETQSTRTWQPTGVFTREDVLPPVFVQDDSPAVCTSDSQCESSCCKANCDTRIQVPLIFGCRANQFSDGHCALSEYLTRASVCDSPIWDGESPTEATVTFDAWWDDPLRRPVDLAPQPRPLSIDQLVRSALINSPHVQVAATTPHIKRTLMLEEQAAFDWRAFAETQYDNLNDPIGNTLTTGNNDDRFVQSEWYGRGGIKRRNRAGGEFDISQRFGTLDNNSRFLLPPNQGNTRLELNYTQPLLNGAGRCVNESLILLASIDFNASTDEMLDRVQAHLLLVTEAYWELHRSRANYLQRRKLLESAQDILDNLQGRIEVDALPRQVLRAKSAVANRQSEISRAKTSIRNAESQLRLLVNDPGMLNSSCIEFIPTDVPFSNPINTTYGDAISTALAHRPDISKAIRDLRSTTVRLGVAKQDLLPQLDLLVSTYVAGLSGNNDVFASYADQFSDGRPGYTVGLQFEVPIGNRAAQARRQRRQWEYTKAIGEFRTVAETAMTEVELAVREVTTTYQEMAARHEAMQASANETSYLVDRWKTLPNIDDSATLLLEDLLDSQERLADEEASFVTAQVNYAVALVKLRQAMGTILLVEKRGPRQ